VFIIVESPPTRVGAKRSEGSVPALGKGGQVDRKSRELIPAIILDEAASSSLILSIEEHDMLTVLLLAAAAPNVNDTSLEDIKRFTNDDRATLKAKYETTRFFDLFLSELKRNTPDEKRRGELDAERHRHRRVPMEVYRLLYGFKNPTDDDPAKLATLRRLRGTIGEAAYKTGGVPPLYPAKYEKEFKTWLDKKFKQGLTTPAKVAEAALAESKKQLEKKLREEQEKEKQRGKD
jgi:hypothetical protein